MGFYYYWDWPLGPDGEPMVDKEYVGAKRGWDAAVRQYLKSYSREGCDSPFLVDQYVRRAVAEGRRISEDLVYWQEQWDIPEAQARTADQGQLARLLGHDCCDGVEQRERRVLVVSVTRGGRGLTGPAASLPSGKVCRAPRDTQSGAVAGGLQQGQELPGHGTNSTWRCRPTPSSGNSLWVEPTEQARPRPWSELPSCSTLG